jgi:hypothetical protein
LILSENPIEVFTNLVGDEVGFKIDDTSSVMFDILRNRMYSNPIYSIVREYTANAVDANVEAGKPDEPIETYCPGDFFIVKDKGLGIGPDRINNVFCYYGRSTKRNTNDEIGGWGIGGKVAFSYPGSDHFLIETNYNSIHYEYLAYIDSTKIGKIKLIGESPTDEVGTSIRIPVIPSDRYQFKAAIQYYYQFLNIPPILHGVSLEKNWSVVRSGSNWFISDKKIPTVNVLLENVPYNQTFVDIKEFPDNLVLTLKQDVVQPSATRETIQTNEENELALKAEYAKVKADIEEIFLAESASATNLFDIVSLRQQLGFKGSFEWNNNFYPDHHKILAELWYGYGKSISRRNLLKDPYVAIDGAILADLRITPYRKRQLSHHYPKSSVWLIPEVNWNFYYTTFPTGLPRLSELKLPAIPRVARKGSGTVQVKTTKSGSWEDYELDTPGKHVYSTLDEIVYNSEGLYNGLGVKFVRKNEVKKVVKKKNWIHVKDYVTKRFNRLKLSKAEMSTIYRHSVDDDFFSTYSCLSDEVPDIQRVYKMVKTHSQDKDTRAVLKFAQQLKLFEVSWEDSEVEKVKAKFNEDYPMLSHLYSSRYLDKKIITDYVRAMKLLREKENGST